MLRKSPLLVAALMIIGCAQQSGGSAQSVAPELSYEEKREIARVERVGRDIYHQDRRAWQAADTLLNVIDPEEHPDLSGWLVHERGGKTFVSFYEKDESLSLLADVVFEGTPDPVVRVSPEREISETERKMFAARELALSAASSECAEEFNTVILESEEGWDVYVLAATRKPDLVMVGGHTLVNVNKAGTEVLETKPLYRSCFAMSKSPDDLPPGAAIEALTMTQSAQPLPTETHIFLNLQHELDFVVVTSSGKWILKKGLVYLMGRG